MVWVHEHIPNAHTPVSLLRRILTGLSRSSTRTGRPLRALKRAAFRVRWRHPMSRPWPRSGAALAHHGSTKVTKWALLRKWCRSMSALTLARLEALLAPSSRIPASVCCQRKCLTLKTHRRRQCHRLLIPPLLQTLPRGSPLQVTRRWFFANLPCFLRTLTTCRVFYHPVSMAMRVNIAWTLRCRETGQSTWPGSGAWKCQPLGVESLVSHPRAGATCVSCRPLGNTTRTLGWWRTTWRSSWWMWSVSSPCGTWAARPLRQLLLLGSPFRTMGVMDAFRVQIGGFQFIVMLVPQSHVCLIPVVMSICVVTCMLGKACMTSFFLFWWRSRRVMIS